MVSLSKSGGFRFRLPRRRNFHFALLPVSYFKEIRKKIAYAINSLALKKIHEI